MDNLIETLMGDGEDCWESLGMSTQRAAACGSGSQELRLADSGYQASHYGATNSCVDIAARAGVGALKSFLRFRSLSSSLSSVCTAILSASLSLSTWALSLAAIRYVDIPHGNVYTAI